MLIIRDAQFEAFRQPLEDAFVERVIVALRSEDAEVTADISTEELEAFVRHGMARARSYGLASAYEIRQYVTFMTWLGRDFDLDESVAWARAILVDASLSAEERVNAIEEYVMSEWEGAV